MDRTPIIAAGAVDIVGKGTYFVAAEAANGARFILLGYGTQDKARADKLAARVTAAGSIDEELWGYHYPRYGSEAWAVENEAACDAQDMIRAGYAHEDDFAGTVIGTLL
jgi:hypothetical protein